MYWVGANYKYLIWSSVVNFEINGRNGKGI